MSAAAPNIAQIAFDQYRSRQQRAQTIVRNRGMSIAEAERHLRPWLAIACLCGADLPELVETLGDLKEIAEASKHPLTEYQMRYLAAEEICPRTTWAPVLQRARDLAFDRFLEHDDAGTLLAAKSLGALARHLQYDINGPQVAPYRAAATRDTAIAA